MREYGTSFTVPDSDKLRRKEKKKNGHESHITMDGPSKRKRGLQDRGGKECKNCPGVRASVSVHQLERTQTYPTKESITRCYLCEIHR